MTIKPFSQMSATGRLGYEDATHFCVVVRFEISRHNDGGGVVSWHPAKAPSRDVNLYCKDPSRCFR